MLKNMYEVAKTRVPEGQLVTVFNADIVDSTGELLKSGIHFQKLKIFYPTIQIIIDKPIIIVSNEVLTLSKDDNSINDPFLVYKSKDPQFYNRLKNFVDRIPRSEENKSILLGNNGTESITILDVSEEIGELCFKINVFGKHKKEVNKENNRVHIYSGNNIGLSDEQIEESFIEFNNIASCNYQGVNDRFIALYYETKRLVRNLK